ncbi:MAG: hydrogenase [Proteobacteria bacterium]|nr:hydrogenase [Pseudomonadota bacterium]MBU1737866.1 hydrogenase [Pseudomonadota bacterium]
MPLFIAAICLLLLSGILAPLGRSGSVLPDRLSLFLGLGGTLLGAAATVLCLGRPEPATLALAWPSINGFFALRIDGLAGVFLLPAFVIAGTGLLYGSGYWPQAKDASGNAWIRTFYPILTAAIALVLAADNGVVFLISWEIMALAGYFLVITEQQQEENFRAGYVYLIATHTGTLALFGLFALLGEKSCLVGLPAAGTLVGGSAILFLLTLIGFGFKAGIMPLHIWLPGAHAAAPSHVSALMSGVMIKTGIYGILRVVSLFQSLPAWWGWTVLGLGILSGILGVVFAIAQHDIKKLLAYHSIENIGIILLGVGTAMLGKSHGLPALAALGLAGALLHVVNHGLFKGLLFLSAGSVVQAMGGREMSGFGGLLRTMPLTGFFFLGGAVAICGLPPLNGFVSEWFIFLGLLQGGVDRTGELHFILLAIPALALIGGLALLCFAKVFGLSFLGRSRSAHALGHEAPPAMLIGMGLLLACCFWIGILPETTRPLLAGALALWTANGVEITHVFGSLAPARAITFSAAFFLALLLPVYLLTRRQRSPDNEVPTWGCGYGGEIPRAQYTTSSFAEMIASFFHWALQTEFFEKKATGIFSTPAAFKSHTPDPVLDLFLARFTRKFAGLATGIRRSVHQGVIGIYLLYSALTLCLLLAIAVFLP